MADLQVGHTPVQVVPDAGCRVQVINNGDDVWYGRDHRLDPSTVMGKLMHDERMDFDEPRWFMAGGNARLHVIQKRFCRRCGWVDG